MLSNSFGKLQKKMTIIHALISFALIILVVAASFALIWWEILAHEKSELIGKIYHEGEEWIASKEPPCNATSINNQSMLAYFVEADGKTVILDQMGHSPVRDALWRKRDVWPRDNEGTMLIRCHDANGKHLRYLVGLVTVKDGDKTVGKLYMFKNMHFYYYAAKRTLFKLLWGALGMLVIAFGISYWLAGKNIEPIKKMYSRLQQFTADASHEMRTPLAVTRLAVESIRADEDSKLSENSNDALGMIDNENRRMTNLTDSLMSLARDDSGTFVMDMGKINISDLCQKVANNLSLVAFDRNIDLKTQIDSDLVVNGNENALEHLLVILLDNSFKYSDQDTTVILKAYSNKSHVILDVMDEGEGIKDEDKERIFDRFYRVDKARSRQLGGLGLGLSLALTIVNAHKGTIKVLDNNPKGTIMRVILK